MSSLVWNPPLASRPKWITPVSSWSLLQVIESWVHEMLGAVLAERFINRLFFYWRPGGPAPQAGCSSSYSTAPPPPLPLEQASLGTLTVSVIVTRGWHEWGAFYVTSRSPTRPPVSQQQTWHRYSYCPHVTIKETKAERFAFSQATQPENGKIQAQPQGHPTTALDFLTTALWGPTLLVQFAFCIHVSLKRLATSASDTRISPQAGLPQLLHTGSPDPGNLFGLLHFVFYRVCQTGLLPAPVCGFIFLSPCPMTRL